MTPNASTAAGRGRAVRAALRIALGALCVLICAYLIISAVSQYREGLALRAQGALDAPLFTRAAAVATLRTAAWPALVAAALAIGLWLWDRRAGRARPQGDAPRTFMGRKPARLTRAARIALIALSLALILLGIMNGSARDTLIKAINICTECVGLG